MPNFFQKFKTSSSSNTTHNNDKKQPNSNPIPASSTVLTTTTNHISNVQIVSNPPNKNNNNSNINNSNNVSSPQNQKVTQPTSKHQSVFSIAFNNNNNNDTTATTNNNNNLKSTGNPVEKPTSSSSNTKKPPKGPSDTSSTKNLSILSLIIDSSILNDEGNNGVLNYEQQIFDPDPAPDETETFNNVVFLDDRSFIVDDDNLDNEVAEINNTKITGLAKENNCYTINEVPEGRSSRFNSSRASSRSSLGSESTRTSSNFYGDQSDHLSSGLADMNRLKKVKSDSHQGSEESGSGSDNMNLNNGSKNALLDALMRKFNVDVEAANDSGLNQPSASDDPNKLVKQTTKYTGDDSKKKQSELQKKINRTQIEKQQQQQTPTQATTPNTNTNFMKNFISKDILEKVDATSSMDDDPKQIKIVRSTGTQMSAVSKITTYKQRLKPNAVTRLPQSFECKYIGKTKCVGLWGIKNIREPVDRLVGTAKRHKSLNELPSVEALISEKGIYIVQKSKSNNAELSKTIRTTTTTTNSISSGHATIGEKLYRSGLLPISNISYAVQDNIFGKIFSCIVVRERDNKTISECYSFLCSRNDVARRMALAITVAFKEYGKLLQIKESRINQTIKLQGATNDPDSYA